MQSESLLQKQRKKEHGSTILEAMLSMIVLCLVLFGLLQISVLYISQMITDFSAFRTARSAVVGFNEHCYQKESRITAIPASGQILVPSHIQDVEGMYERLKQEKLAVLDYLSNYNTSLKYDYWYSGENTYGSTGNVPVRASTYLHQNISRGSSSLKSEVQFVDYPMIFPFAKSFLPSGKLNLTGNAAMSNYYSEYLKD